MGENYRRRGNQLSLGRRWTPDEKDSLNKMAYFLPPKMIARKINRSSESVRKMAKRMGIRFLTARGRNLAAKSKQNL